VGRGRRAGIEQARGLHCGHGRLNHVAAMNLGIGRIACQGGEWRGSTSSLSSPLCIQLLLGIVAVHRTQCANPNLSMRKVDVTEEALLDSAKHDFEGPITRRGLTFRRPAVIEALESKSCLLLPTFRAVAVPGPLPDLSIRNKRADASAGKLI
jgi:hypothetical protein